MFKIARPLFLICETPLHAGSGDALGVVDLPIQRERHTGFPKIEASSLKGALRESFEENDKEIEINNQKIKVNELDPKGKFPIHVSNLFGPEEEEARENPHSGAIGFTDGRLLLFPVKSAKGIFAYTTCPQVLEKFLKEMELAQVKDIPKLPGQNTVPEKTGLLASGNNVILEEYTFPVTPEKICTDFAIWLAKKLFSNSPELSYWQKKLSTDLIVLSDDDFKDMVNLFTEVITRTQINNETGTVKDGALFTEEFLPQESILYSLVMASPEFKKDGKPAEDVMGFFEKGLSPVFQLGGNATLGKGLLRKVF